MRSSFNAYGCVSSSVGASTPVWLGNPYPVPVGGTLNTAFLKEGILIPAGSPVNLASKVLTPFRAWEVVSFTPGDGTTTLNDTIVVYPAKFGNVEILPAANDLIQKVGSTFASTGKAAKVISVTALTGDDAGKYSIAVLHSATIDSVSEGDFIALSSAASAGSSKSLANQPNGYLYNDIYLGDLDVSSADISNYTIAATGAVIMYHPEGILIDLTPAAEFKSQMAAAVPGVYQVSV